MKAVVVGGGIGGLAAAIALEKRGVRAEVYERASELREVGAGISLWANALFALEALGISAASLQHGAVDAKATVRTSKGTVVAGSSYAEMTRRFGAAFVVLHRAELLATLRSKLREGALHLDHECVGVSQDATGTHARFANGATASGDVLIGADGLRSVVRAQLFGDSPPRYAGYTAWRSVVAAPNETVVAGESWDRGCRFGIVPLGDGRVYWFAVHNEPAGGSDDADGGAKQRLLRLFRGWHAPIEALIAAAHESSIIRGDIYDREPLPRWTDGRITLLGDAAHPMTPNLGQGACQAIEDAVALAVCLSATTDAALALRQYDERRRRRSAKVVLQSRRIGAIAQWENPFLCGLRNMFLRAMPRGSTERQIEWVVGYRALTPEERRRFDGGST